MKGFPGICQMCKYKNKMTVEVPCWNCISNEDLAMLKPDEETEYACFEAIQKPQKEEKPTDGFYQDCPLGLHEEDEEVK